MTGSLFGDYPWESNRLTEVSGCVFDGTGVSFDDMNPDDLPYHAGSHNNNIVQVSGTSILISNNIICNSYGEVVMIGNPGTVSYIYNNVFFNNIKSISLDGRNENTAEGYPTNRVAYLYNNTIQNPNSCIGGDQSGIYVLYATNNHFICDGDPGVWFPEITRYEGNNLTNTLAAAYAAGYTTNNLLAPSSTNAPTVDAGISISSVGTDRLGVARGAPYDIGAYEGAGEDEPTPPAGGGTGQMRAVNLNVGTIIKR